MRLGMYTSQSGKKECVTLMGKEEGFGNETVCAWPVSRDITGTPSAAAAKRWRGFERIATVCVIA